jgi:DNA-binding transcriptional ArsR family regulator
MPKPKGIEEVELTDRVFSALAHPARRQILLSVHDRGQCNAGEIANRFDCSWPTTSRHLATLVACGLLDVENVGRERLFRSNTKRVQKVLNTWSAYFD